MRDRSPEIKRRILEQTPGFYFSSVSKIETLGYKDLTDFGFKRLSRLFSRGFEIPLTEQIVGKAIALRRERKMTLGDAIIGASALHYGLTLATRNTIDFRHLQTLKILNPFAAI